MVDLWLKQFDHSTYGPTQNLEVLYDVTYEYHSRLEYYIWFWRSVAAEIEQQLVRDKPVDTFWKEKSVGSVM